MTAVKHTGDYQTEYNKIAAKMTAGRKNTRNIEFLFSNRPLRRPMSLLVLVCYFPQHNF